MISVQTKLEEKEDTIFIKGLHVCTFITDKKTILGVYQIDRGVYFDVLDNKKLIPDGKEIELFWDVPVTSDRRKEDKRKTISLRNIKNIIIYHQNLQKDHALKIRALDPDKPVKLPVVKKPCYLNPFNINITTHQDLITNYDEIEDFRKNQFADGKIKVNGVVLNQEYREAENGSPIYVTFDEASINEPYNLRIARMIRQRAS